MGGEKISYSANSPEIMLILDDFTENLALARGLQSKYTPATGNIGEGRHRRSLPQAKLSR
jgi:hypothetical protein